MSRVNDLIMSENADVLVGLVMKLTGGSANPNVVYSQISRVRSEYDQLSRFRNEGAK